MDDRTDPVINWPDHLGLGGLSARSMRCSRKDKAPLRALTALLDWSDTIGLLGPVDRRQVERFPFAELVGHYRCVGRADVCDELTDQLRRINSALQLAPDDIRRQWWPLPQWIPCAVDQFDDSHLATELLSEVTDSDDGPDSASSLIAMLAADLVRTEAVALQGVSANRHQRQRLQACLHVLDHAGAQYLDGRALTNRPTTDVRTDEMVVIAKERAARVETGTSARVRAIAELSMLPVTKLHDEQMFIRCLQMFETQYRQIGGCLIRARDALLRLDAEVSYRELVGAVSLLRLSPLLYRVMTTMPPDMFAIIRTYTGRSAIQSRAHRGIEFLSAPRPADSVELEGPTVQEAFVAAADLLDPVDTARTVVAMAELDSCWRGVKRTHAGITLKIIGSAPSGADEMPLFPLLAKIPTNTRV